MVDENKTDPSGMSSEEVCAEYPVEVTLSEGFTNAPEGTLTRVRLREAYNEDVRKSLKDPRVKGTDDANFGNVLLQRIAVVQLPDGSFRRPKFHELDKLKLKDSNRLQNKFQEMNTASEEDVENLSVEDTDSVK